MKFGRSFEQEFLNQGFDENRSMDESLDLAWKLLRMFPADELNRINPKLLEEYY
jgi:V/A-type H+-transporting ATPase subunit B